MNAAFDKIKNQKQGSAHNPYAASRFWRLMPAGMRRRWWLFRLFDTFVRLLPIFKRRRGLLIIRMDGIGDMVLFRQALDHYPEIFGVAKEDITILGCNSWGSLSDIIFEGYKVITIDEHNFARKPIYRLKIAFQTRLIAPEITICDSYFRRALMADSLVWLSRAKRSIVSLPYINEPTRVEYKYYLSQFDEIIPTGRYPTNEIQRHFDFVSKLAGREIPIEAPSIPWRDAPAPIAEGAPYVVLNPGSNEPGRRWPFSGYVEIANRLLEKGYRVVVVGVSDESYSEEAARLPKHENLINLVGKTRLDQLLDLLKNAAAVLSNDSGPAHLSIAIGAATLVVVGGGHFKSFFPYPENACPQNARFVYQEMDCYHCFWRCPKRATKFDTFPCVGAVTVDQVWNQIEDLLVFSGHNVRK